MAEHTQHWEPTFGGGTNGAVYVEGVVGGVAMPMDLEAVGGVAVTLGQKAMAASIPVVIASDQRSAQATYTASGVSAGVSLGTAGALFALMMGNLKSAYVHRIHVGLRTPATNPGTCVLELMRISVAGTASSHTVTAHDSADPAFGGNIVDTFTVAPTVGNRLGQRALRCPGAMPVGEAMDYVEWTFDDLNPIIVPAGTANGLCVQVAVAAPGAVAIYEVEFSWF